MALCYELKTKNWILARLNFDPLICWNKMAAKFSHLALSLKNHL